jgi:uncharacterized membrane protein
VRLRQIAGGIATADNARFLAMPWPVVVHIAGAVLFALPGAFQFSAQRRRRRMQWHRLAGSILVPCGFAVSLSGLWMAQFYPRAGLDGVAVYWERIVVGVAMTGALWLGFSAVRRHDVGAHRAWMMRAYALGMGAGTQVFTTRISSAWTPRAPLGRGPRQQPHPSSFLAAMTVCRLV